MLKSAAQLIVRDSEVAEKDRRLIHSNKCCVAQNTPENNIKDNQLLLFGTVIHLIQYNLIKNNWINYLNRPPPDMSANLCRPFQKTKGEGLQPCGTETETVYLLFYLFISGRVHYK